MSGVVAHSHVLLHHSSTCRVGQKKSHISAQGDADGSSPAIVWEFCLKHHSDVPYDAPKWNTVTVSSQRGQMIARLMWFHQESGCDCIIALSFCGVLCWGVEFKCLMSVCMRRTIEPFSSALVLHMRFFVGVAWWKWKNTLQFPVLLNQSALLNSKSLTLQIL